MRLLFIIPEYPPHSGGGIITFYKNLIPELTKLGHKVRIIVGSAFSGNFNNYSSDGVDIEFLDQSKISEKTNQFTKYSAIPEFQRHIAAAWVAWEQADEGVGFDLVETTDWGFLFAPWLVDSSAPPTVVQCHGSVGQISYNDPKNGQELLGIFTRLLERQMLSKAQELQTYSQSNASEWTTLTNRDVSYIPPAWKNEVISLPHFDTNRRGLVVGRIQYWKGPTVLCEALRLLGNNAPFIDWVGRDTPYQDAGKSMSTYLAETYPDVWGKKIIALGPRTPIETAYLQSQAEFVVVPSIWDVFNFTCIESMGQGRVVFCSNGAGASELISDGINGYTFQNNNPAELAEKLSRYANLECATKEIIRGHAVDAIDNLLCPKKIAQRRVSRYEQVARQYKDKQNLANIDTWTIDTVKPHPPTNDELAFLDGIPLKSITKYSLTRGLKKFKA